jgi:hypothetical protein
MVMGEVVHMQLIGDAESTWSVEDALMSVLEERKNGNIPGDKAIIIIFGEVNGKVQAASWTQAGLSTTEIRSLIEYITYQMSRRQPPRIPTTN